jgi:hypothetical protein
MKKITFLLLTILPLIALGQITNSTFDSDISGWNTNGSASWNGTEGYVAPGSAEFVAAAGNNFRSSPNSQLAVAGDYDVSFWVKGAIGTTIKAQVFGWATGNPSGDDLAMTGDWIEYTYTFTGCQTGINGNIRIVGVTAGTFYIDDAYFTFVIPPGSTFLTTTVNGAGTITKTPDQSYYAPTDNVTVEAVPATHWSFGSWSGDLTGSTNPETLLMDTDKTVTANFEIDPTFDYDFTFDTPGDLESWTTDPQVSVASHTGGLVTFSIVADQWARINLQGFPIPSASYNKVTITLQNETTNDELGFIVDDGSPEVQVQTITTNDTGIQSYFFDLTQNTKWTGDVNYVRIRIADNDNTANAGRPLESGNIIIDNVEFTFDPGLGTSEFLADKLSMFPNPTKGQLNLNYQGTIKNVQIFDITGKTVIETGTFTNSTQVDISNLNQGLYLVKVLDESSNSAIKKLIVN